MRKGLVFGLVALAVTAGSSLSAWAAPAGAAESAPGLRKPADFDSITDEQQRSAALFLEAGKVIQSPRCLNCHPSGDRPSQGDQMRPHQPLVLRGADGHGTSAMRCVNCHQAQNNDSARLPGHPKWGMAPLSMGWHGKSLHDICEQMKDTKRNGGMTPEQIVHHVSEDTLVGWAWKPDASRTPAPGTQKEFGALIAAWVRTGQFCPE